MFCPRKQKELTEPECWGIILGTETGEGLTPCLACDYGHKLAETCPINKRQRKVEATDKAKLKAMLDLLQAYDLAECPKTDQDLL